ncbi:MAG: asparagine synthase (glutamine-hydrolyzing), partial [Cyclobacteriaceae bacterium]
MCGFAGFFANEILTQGHSDQVKQGTATLSKRGPDADGFFSDQQVALGHRRLSINDISEQGTQPMSASDDRYQIVFNGEIYNYKSLRQELVTKGFTFKSETDTEVLLYGYIAWGAEVLQRLNGFFAFAIYDSQLREVFVARDRFGIKPLVYAVLADGIAFGSEIKSILPLIGKKEIDREALNLYFELTYIPSPNTIFKGISKLAPGKYLRIGSTGIESHQYYEVPYREEASISKMAEGISALRPLLKKAVTDRLVADVPVGTFLSGGIDSSIITALAAQEHHQIDSFSIGFRDNPYYDETEYALAVAKKWKTNHHVFSLTSEDLLEHAFSAIDYLDEPFADSSALPVFILSKLTKEHVTVALSGDGADEIFSGYNKHEAYSRAGQPSLSNRLIDSLGSLATRLPQSRDSRLADLSRKFSKYHDLLQLSGADRYWMLA